MASGDTKLTICSDAMIMLGASPISSFSETTDAAKTADRLYDAIRDTCIQTYDWSWSIKKVKLARLDAAPINEWMYAYALPGDILGDPKALFNSSSVGARPVTEWEVYGTQIYCNYADVYIDYQYAVDESRMPTYFVQMLKNALASAFAIPVTDQVSKADYYRALAYGSPGENGRGGMMRTSMNIDGGRPAQAIEDFPLTDVR